MPKPIGDCLDRGERIVRPEASVVHFPATEVGARSIARLRVANVRDDEAALALERKPSRCETAVILEGMRPIDEDIFGDFAVTTPRSERLEPRASTTLELEFHPTRAIAQQQRFALVVDGAPQGEVRLEGIGKEVPGKRGEDRIAETERAAAELEASRRDDALRAPRVHATTAIRTWARDAKRRNQLAADWARENWTEFVGRTGGDYTVYRTDPLVSFATHAITDWLELTFEPESLALHLVAKHAAEAISEFFVEHLAGGHERPSDAEQLLAATTQTANVTNAKGRELDVHRERADLVVADSEAAAELRVQQARNSAELERWLAWASRQRDAMPAKRDVGDRSLRDELLKEWVLQRAATTTSANQHTNPEAWKRARAHLAEAGTLTTTEQPDLFLHQCRYEWEKLGLADVDKAIAELDLRRRKIEADSRAWGNDARASARQVAAFLSARDQVPIMFHRSNRPEQTAREFAPSGADLKAAMGEPDSFAQFEIACHLQLEAVGGAVQVKYFRYFRHDAPGGSELRSLR